MKSFFPWRITHFRWGFKLDFDTRCFSQFEKIENIFPGNKEVHCLAEANMGFEFYTKPQQDKVLP